MQSKTNWVSGMNKSWLLSGILFFLFFSVNTNAQQYKNLAFEGGGIRGIAYTGAIKVLEEHHITDSIENIAGTSVGAITAVLMSVGYSADELKKILFDLRVQKFNDGQWFFIGGQKRFRKQFGWYRGDRLEDWIGELIAAKTGHADLNFAQLHQLKLKDKKYKDLFITATNLSKQKAVVFSWQPYPNMQIKTAVRASMSVPLYFSAVFLDSAGNKVKKPKAENACDIFIDGGVLANYPLTTFDSGYVKGNPHTLGLKLERPEQLDYYKQSRDIAPYNIHHFTTYVSALYNLVIERLNRDTSFAYEDYRTIYISTSNMNPRVRHITTGQKEILYRNGKIDAGQFFSKQK